MLPDHTLSSQAVQYTFKEPSGIITNSRLVCWERGGLAIQNTSMGVDFQNWKGICTAGGSCSIQAGELGAPVHLFDEPGTVEFSFCFDQNMRWQAANIVGTNLIFRWYDPTIPGYTSTTYADVVSAKLTLDDKRDLEVQLGKSDVLLTYIKSNNNLYFREQRDRYLVEYLLQSNLPAKTLITNFGMTLANRVQWRFLKRFGGA